MVAAVEATDQMTFKKDLHFYSIEKGGRKEVE